MDTRAKHYQELREQMIDLKKALQGVANLGDDFTGKGADNIKSFYKELAGNVDMFISFIDKQKAFHEGLTTVTILLIHYPYLLNPPSFSQ